MVDFNQNKSYLRCKGMYDDYYMRGKVESPTALPINYQNSIVIQ